MKVFPKQRFVLGLSDPLRLNAALKTRQGAWSTNEAAYLKLFVCNRIENGIVAIIAIGTEGLLPLKTTQLCDPSLLALPTPIVVHVLLGDHGRRPRSSRFSRASSLKPSAKFNSICSPGTIPLPKEGP
jgi:hypothetical protein